MYKLLIPFIDDHIPPNVLSFIQILKKQMGCRIVSLAFENGHHDDTKKSNPAGSQKEQLLLKFPLIDELIQADPLSSDSENIIQVWQDHTIDMLLLGGNPMTNQDHLIHQNTLENLYHEIICPTLFITGPIDQQNLSTITLYVSQDPIGKKESITLFRDLADALNSKVHLLSVIKPSVHDNSEILEGLKKMADKFRFINYSINTTYNTSIIEGIRFFKHKKRTHMVALTVDRNNPQNKLNLVKNLLSRFTDTIICAL
jgi:hypothetical protein